MSQNPGCGAAGEARPGGADRVHHLRNRGHHLHAGPGLPLLHLRLQKQQRPLPRQLRRPAQVRRGGQRKNGLPEARY